MNIPELVKIPALIFQRPPLLFQTSISRSESGAVVAGCNCRDELPQLQHLLHPHPSRWKN